MPWRPIRAAAAESSVSSVLSALIGSVSFAGSMIAFGKLQDLISGRPITYPGQKVGNLALLAALVGIGIAIVAGVENQWLFVVLIAGSLLFGVLFVLPIGGADMPVVISLLNAHGGRRVRHRFRPAPERADRQRDARRRVGDAADAEDGARDGTFGLECPVRGVRAGAGPGDAAAAAGDGAGALGERRGRGGHARLRAARDHRPRVRAGGRSGAARRAQARGRARAPGVDVRYAIHPLPAGCPGT